MTNSEKLKSGYEAYRKLNALREARQIAFEIACKSTSKTSDLKVQSSGGNLQEKRNIDYIELSEELEKQIRECLKILKSNLKMIKNVKEPLLQLILMRRYISFKSWNEIANDLHYDRRYILKMHNNALKKIDELQKKTLKDT